MVNVKKKGNLWENKLANWLVDNGVKAWKDAQSGGGTREKGDIGNNIDLTIESKAAKNIKLMEWWRQVDKAASIHKNSPALFIHQDGMPDNEWLVVMHSEDWIEMIIKSKDKEIAHDPVEDSWEKKRAFDQLKVALTNANRFL